MVGLYVILLFLLGTSVAILYKLLATDCHCGELQNSTEQMALLMRAVQEVGNSTVINITEEKVCSLNHTEELLNQLIEATEGITILALLLAQIQSY